MKGGVKMTIESVIITTKGVRRINGLPRGFNLEDLRERLKYPTPYVCLCAGDSTETDVDWRWWKPSPQAEKENIYTPHDVFTYAVDIDEKDALKKFNKYSCIRFRKLVLIYIDVDEDYYEDYIFAIPHHRQPAGDLDYIV